MTDTEHFLESIFGGAESGFILVWTLPDRRSRFFTIDCLDAAAHYAIDLAGTHDPYVGCALHDHDHGEHERGRAEDVVSIPGLWADVDIAKPGATKKPYFPTRIAATTFLDTLPILPTLRVWSGGGFHAWWLFREPWAFADADDHDRGARSVRAWQAYLHARALEHGATIDATHDLTRVLRLPGTLNYKHGTTVDLVCSDGPRAEPGDFAGWCVNVPMLPPPPVVAGIIPSIKTPLPAAKLAALLANDTKFARTWARQRRDLRDQSPSGYDQALASLAVHAGWTDAEVVALLVAHRRQHGGIEKLARADYLARTIARARAPREGDVRFEQAVAGGLGLR